MTSVNVLSPHFDDGVLSCWAVLDQAKYPTVTTVFGGIPEPGTSTGWDRRCGEPNSTLLVQRRIRENAVALRGVSARAINLPYLDTQYSEEERDQSAIEQSIRNVVEQDAIIYAPIAIAGLRRHIDHITVQKVGKEMLENGRDVRFYADLPYAIPLPYDQDWPDRLHIPTIEDVIGIELEAEKIELTPQQQAGKAKAVRDYTSQFRAVSEEHENILDEAHFYEYEVLFRPYR